MAYVWHSIQSPISVITACLTLKYFNNIIINKCMFFFLWPASILPGVTKTGRAINASAAPVATVTAVKAKNKQYRIVNAFQQLL